MSNQLNNISAAIAVPPVLGSKINTVTSDDGPTYPPAAPPTTSADEPQDAPKLTSKPSETSLLDKPTPESSPKTKKEIIRKALKDLWTFLKTPLGFIVGIYGFLVVVWGAALVIILAGWTPMSKNTQDIWVEICSQVLNGLFTVTGIGLIPWRVRDAWHMSVITRYRRKIIKLARRHLKAGHQPRPVYPESSLDLTYLDEREKRRLARSEGKFMESQPWYNPQETDAHRVSLPSSSHHTIVQRLILSIL
jgi:hypothetical protein